MHFRFIMIAYEPEERNFQKEETVNSEMSGTSPSVIHLS